jgi:YD repeat-containing protein
MTIETYPTTLGQLVTVTLVNGETTQAYWDGLQWWVGVEDDDNDAPIINEFVASWE